MAYFLNNTGKQFRPRESLPRMKYASISYACSSLSSCELMQPETI